MSKILIHPLGVVVETCATTYHELTLTFLPGHGYYFSDSPHGARVFGRLPAHGEVYLRQQAPLSSAIESLVADDPLNIPIDQGVGVIKPAHRVPKGIEMVLREIKFNSVDPELDMPETTVTINGQGPIPFTFIRASRTGILNYPLRRFESTLQFGGCPGIVEAVIVLASATPSCSLPLLLPSITPLDIKTFFPHRLETFQCFPDGSFRWSPNDVCYRNPCAIELPAGYHYWKVVVHADDTDIIVATTLGVANVDVGCRVQQIILVPPGDVPADSILAYVCFRECLHD